LTCHPLPLHSFPTRRSSDLFRPDKALSIANPKEFNAWLTQLEQASNIDISFFKDFLSALKQRHDFFHSNGCRLSDHGLKRCYSRSEEHTSELQSRGHLVCRL